MQTEEVQRKEPPGSDEPQKLDPSCSGIRVKRRWLAGSEREQQKGGRRQSDAVERRRGRLELAKPHQDRRGAERYCTGQESQQWKSKARFQSERFDDVSPPPDDRRPNHLPFGASEPVMSRQI